MMACRKYSHVCLALVAFIATGTAQAQLERVSPKKAEKKPANILKKKDKAAAEVLKSSEGQEGPLLKGIKIVGTREEVQTSGDASVTGVQIAAGAGLDVLRTSRFPALMSRHLGRAITESSINRIQTEIVRYYRDEGRPLVDVILPAQESVGKGVLQLIVIEATLGKIEVEGSKWTKNGFITSTLRSKTDQPIDTNQLLEDVDWLNQNPGRHVDVAFKPGSKLGQSDMMLRVQEERPFRVYAGYEDNGPIFTGEHRVNAGFSWFNAFGKDQRINYQYSTDTDFSLVHAHSVSYEVPLPWRHTLTIYGGYVDSKSDFNTALFTQRGTSYQVSMRYELPLEKYRNLSSSLSAGFDFKSFNNNLEFGGVPVIGTAVQVAQFAVAYKGIVPDSWGSTAARLEGYLSPGDVTGKNNNTAFATQRRLSNASYAYGRLSLERDTKLPAGWMWVVKATGQISDGNLQGSEQLGLGGGTTVRGYDEREANGDRGYYFSTEIWTPALPVMHLISKKLPDGLNLIGFFDCGEADKVSIIAGEDPHIGLASVGAGLRYNFDRNLSVRFDYGWQLKDTGPVNPHSNENSRGHVAVQLSY